MPISHFVEYGKYFIPRGASDFEVLAYSDRKLAQKAGEYYRRLYFPDTSPLQVGDVSFAFFPIEPGTYLFIHIQRRRENDFIKKGNREPDNNTSMGRLFNQIRFSVLESEDLRDSYVAGQVPFFDLMQHGTRVNLMLNQWIDVMQSKQDFTGIEERKPILYDYQAIIGEQDPQQINLRATINTSILYALIKPAYEEKLVSRLKFFKKVLLTIATSIFEVQNTQKNVHVIYSGLSLIGKLLIVQDLQRLVYWKTGWLSFALDYVSVPTTSIRLQFRKKTEVILEDYQPIIVDVDAEREIIKVDGQDSDEYIKQRSSLLDELINWLESKTTNRDKLWAEFNKVAIIKLKTNPFPDIVLVRDASKQLKRLLSAYCSGKLSVSSINEYFPAFFAKLDNEGKREFYNIIRVWNWEYNSIPDTIVRNMISYLIYFSLNQILLAEIRFWLEHIDPNTTDDALGYLVKKQISREPVTSYWSVARDITIQNTEILFIQLIDFASTDKILLNRIALDDFAKLSNLHDKFPLASTLLNNFIKQIFISPAEDLYLIPRIPVILMKLATQNNEIHPLLIEIITRPIWQSYRDGYFQSNIREYITKLCKILREKAFIDAAAIVAQWDIHKTELDSEEKINIAINAIINFRNIKSDKTNLLIDSPITDIDDLFAQAADNLPLLVGVLTGSIEFALVARKGIEFVGTELLKKITANNLYYDKKILFDGLFQLFLDTIENDHVPIKIAALKYFVPCLYALAEKIERPTEYFIALLPSSLYRKLSNPKTITLFSRWLLESFYPDFISSLTQGNFEDDQILELTGQWSGNFDRILIPVHTPSESLFQYIPFFLSYNYALINNWYIAPLTNNKYESLIIGFKDPFRKNVAKKLSRITITRGVGIFIITSSILIGLFIIIQIIASVFLKITPASLPQHNISFINGQVEKKRIETFPVEYSNPPQIVRGDKMGDVHYTLQFNSTSSAIDVKSPFESSLIETEDSIIQPGYLIGNKKNFFFICEGFYICHNSDKTTDDLVFSLGFGSIGKVNIFLTGLKSKKVIQTIGLIGNIIIVSFEGENQILLAKSFLNYDSLWYVYQIIQLATSSDDKIIDIDTQTINGINHIVVLVDAHDGQDRFYLYNESFGQWKLVELWVFEKNQQIVEVYWETDNEILYKANIDNITSLSGENYDCIKGCIFSITYPLMGEQGTAFLLISEK